MQNIPHLQLRTMIPIMLKAFAERRLEVQTNGGVNGCHYVGPCVIGVCLDYATQEAWDNKDGDTSIDAILREGLATCDPEEKSDISYLQASHDCGNEWVLAKALVEMHVKHCT